MAILSIMVTVNISQSVSEAVNAILVWFLPFFVGVSVFRTNRDIMLIVRTIVICAIFVAIVGLADFVQEKNLMIRIMPGFMYDNMMQDPSFAHMLIPQYRNGVYRAPSIFGVSLSFGEFAAFVAPLGAFFLLYGSGIRDRALGFVVVLTSFLGVYVSGSRGANGSLIVAIVVLVGLWIVRERKINPYGLLAPTMMAMAVVGFSAILALTMVSNKAHDAIFGVDDPMSTQARVNQWEIGRPKILERPITGYGFATSGIVLAYGDPDFLTVDSYPLTLMIDTGVPSLVFFIMMVGGAIWSSARAFLADLSIEGAIYGPFASALAGFVTYRWALSQTENHTLIFLVCGMIVASTAPYKQHLVADKPKSAQPPPRKPAAKQPDALN
jgi:O-antigen ligase